MTQDGSNPGRRRFLAVMTSAVGAVGAVGAVSPFVASWSPSEKAKALGAPIKVDVSKLSPGAMLVDQWRGKPIFIIRRTEQVLQSLQRADLQAKLADPESKTSAQQPQYAANALRSIEPEWLVVEGVCTHLGCAPKYVPEIQPQTYDANWQGGFFCPCHGSKFDLAGRVYKGVPAPSNLKVPPHKIEGPIITIGEETA